jgi:hypothetical protein
MFASWYIVGGLSLTVAEAVLIFEMVRLRAKRRKAEKALFKSEEAVLRNFLDALSRRSREMAGPKAYILRTYANASMPTRMHLISASLSRFNIDFGVMMENIVGLSTQVFPDSMRTVFLLDT